MGEKFILLIEFHRLGKFYSVCCKCVCWASSVSLSLTLALSLSLSLSLSRSTNTDTKSRRIFACKKRKTLAPVVGRDPAIHYIILTFTRAPGLANFKVTVAFGN